MSAAQDRPIQVLPDEHEGTTIDVHVLGAPLLLWERSSVHTSDLMREFALLRFGLEDQGAQPGGGSRREVPARLLRLMDELRQRFEGISQAQARQRVNALRDGLRTLDLTYSMPPSVGQACQELLDLLDEADDYCEAGEQLMTMVAPPDQQMFRRWYLLEFVRQVQGEPPQPWTGSTD